MNRLRVSGCWDVGFVAPESAQTRDETSGRHVVNKGRLRSHPSLSSPGDIGTFLDAKITARVQFGSVFLSFCLASVVEKLQHRLFTAKCSLWG